MFAIVFGNNFIISWPHLIRDLRGGRGGRGGGGGGGAKGLEGGNEQGMTWRKLRGWQGRREWKMGVKENMIEDKGEEGRG